MFHVCFRAEGGRRRGYMGHLTRIANSIVHNCDKGPNGLQIQQLISGEKVPLSEGSYSSVIICPAN